MRTGCKDIFYFVTTTAEGFIWTWNTCNENHINALPHVFTTHFFIQFILSSYSPTAWTSYTDLNKSPPFHEPLSLIWPFSGDSAKMETRATSRCAFDNVNCISICLLRCWSTHLHVWVWVSSELLTKFETFDSYWGSRRWTFFCLWDSTSYR